MSYIDKLKDRQGEQLLPQTHERAVKDSNGTTLETKLQDINSALDDRYTKEVVNGLISTPHQSYVSVSQYSALPATGSTDTIYRVSNYDGTAIDNTKYAEYGWNGSQYILLAVKSSIGEVFDISDYNSGATYNSLSEALGGSNVTNIPNSVRKAGMSIKYKTITPATFTVAVTSLTALPSGAMSESSTIPLISSGTYKETQLTGLATLPSNTGAANAITLYYGSGSNYKSFTITRTANGVAEYVQYRHLGTTNSTSSLANVGNWQGVDDIPMNGSRNLMESGGTFSAIAKVGIYDISAEHLGETYETLSEALGTNGANVPAEYRVPGMTVRYIHSSDNKYVEWRYNSSSITNADFVNTENWIGVDDEPIPGSHNLVESGGVFKNYNPLLQTLQWERGIIDNQTGQNSPSNYSLRSDSVLFRDVFDVSASCTLGIFYYSNNGSYIGFDSNIKQHSAGYAYSVRFVLSNGTTLINSPESVDFNCEFTRNGINNILQEVETKANKADLEDVNKVATNTSIILEEGRDSLTLTVRRVNSYIKTNGTVGSSDTFDIYTPILLRRGEVITLKCINFDSRAVIALTNANGDSYTTVVKGKDASSNIYQYSYLAMDDCYVALSYYRGSGSDIAIIKSKRIIGIENDVIVLENEQYQNGLAFSSPVYIRDKGYYNTFGNVGDTASMVYNSSSNYRTAIINALAGDIYYISGTGGNSPKLWALLDDNNKILAASPANDVQVNYQLKIPTNCKLVINVIVAYSYSAYKMESEEGAFANIESFSRLNKLKPNEPLFKIDYFLGFAGIIHHWGFIGDSLMGGYMENISASDYEYSWGQRMCKLLGVEGYNFSVGGQTAKGWIEDAQSSDPNRFNRSWGGAKTNLKQAYIIGLGVNDRVQSYPVGDTSTDIGVYDGVNDSDTNADTFVGYYAGIIQRLQYVNPTAKIFVVTLPTKRENYNDVKDYNTAITNMASVFNNVYVIDLYTYADNFYMTQWYSAFFSGHFNVIGYEYCASAMMTYIDFIIRNDYDAFKNVNTIPHS